MGVKEVVAIDDFACGDGYGYGYGDGDGDGNGYGYGYGDGIGNGNGYGDGYGKGYGIGDGYGEGYGKGDGYGDGNGYGYGNGDGYGKGDGYGIGDGSQVVFVKALVQHLAGKRGLTLIKQGAKLAIWRSRADGTPANGGGGGARKIGDIESVAGPLSICTRNALHATLHPPAWKGERLWVVALYPPVVRQDDKLASLKREIICEIPNFYD